MDFYVLLLGYTQQYPTYPPPPYGYADWRQATVYPFAPPHPYLQQHPQYSQFSYMAPNVPQFVSYHQIPPKKPEDDKNDPHATTINQIVQQVTQELKNTLKKDFNKKMVEMTAFSKFETW